MNIHLIEQMMLDAGFISKKLDRRWDDVQIRKYVGPGYLLNVVVRELDDGHVFYLREEGVEDVVLDEFSGRLRILERYDPLFEHCGDLDDLKKMIKTGKEENL